MSQTNVVQPVGGNKHGTARLAAQMDCTAGKKSAIGGLADGAGIETGAVQNAGPTDAQSIVIESQSVDNETIEHSCNIPCHKLSRERHAAELGGNQFSEGGRGSRARRGRGVRIGFERTENFSNVLVAAAAVVGKSKLIARVVKTGQIVLVDVVGVEMAALQLPTYLVCHKKKKGGGLVFTGPVPKWRCPQCRISSPLDCLEQPCGWTEKKKGGAA